MQVFLPPEDVSNLHKELAKLMIGIRDTLETMNKEAVEANRELIEIISNGREESKTVEGYVMFKAKVHSQLTVFEAIINQHLEKEKEIVEDLDKAISLNRICIAHVDFIESDKEKTLAALIENQNLLETFKDMVESSQG